jgi:hypothetical protein
MSSDRLYVRVRGKVLGPFSFAQLQALRDRGQLRRFHEVSPDRSVWSPASSLADLFPPETGVQTSVQQADVLLLEQAAPREVKTAGGWYYNDAEGQMQGPVERAHLDSLLDQGALSGSTLVWREGLSDWVRLDSLETKGASRTRSDAGPGTAALAALGRFFTDPVGGLPGLCQALGLWPSLGLGLLFGLIFDFCLLLAALLAAADAGKWDRPVAGFEPPPHPLRLSRDLEPADKVALLAKVFGLALLPVFSLSGAVAIGRAVSRGNGNIGFDVLSAGAALLPLGLWCPVAALLGLGNAEVSGFLFLMMACLTVLILNSAFTRVVGLSDRGAVLAIPVTLVLSAWLSKVVILAVLVH